MALTGSTSDQDAFHKAVNGFMQCAETVKSRARRLENELVELVRMYKGDQAVEFGKTQQHASDLLAAISRSSDTMGELVRTGASRIAAADQEVAGMFQGVTATAAETSDIVNRLKGMS